ncbi:MAG: response regulator [Planctomycetota bacterium]|nr:response regulator [Planctomycetota bacterium]
MAILIVEDDADLLRLTARLLRAWGMPTAVAVDGDEALVLIRKIHPSLILTDYHMPKFDGVSLARAVRSLGISTPILLLTADGDWHIEQQARDAGVTRVLKKPIIPEMLRKVIEELYQARPGPDSAGSFDPPDSDI